MKAELDIKPFLKAINEFRTEEQQPCGVQVVEWVGFSCLEADRLRIWSISLGCHTTRTEQFGGTQLVIIVGVEFCENDVEI